jgi:hypothetical protein
MMRHERFGLTAEQPRGWEVAIARRAPGPVISRLSADDPVPAQTAEDVTHPVLHACTRALPADRGDFGSGVVDILGSEDVFIALIEYGHEVADQGLFATQGMPRLAPSQFSPDRLQRPLPGRSASQHFFSVGGRAFCLFTVVGSHARRMATVPRADGVVHSFRVASKATMLRQGGMP